MKFDLRKLLNGIPFPVIACRKENRRVMCMNPEAGLLTGCISGSGAFIENVLHCRYESDLRLLWKTLEAKKSVENFSLDIFNAQKVPVSLSLYAQVVPTSEEDREIVILCLSATDTAPASDVSSGEEKSGNELLFKMLTIAYHSMAPDQAINGILETLGPHLDVDRVYVFEDASPSVIYEWRAPEANSRTNFSQDFFRDTFAINDIKNGLYVAGNIETLPEKDRSALEAQGVKAIAVLPLSADESSVAFIGCDECRRYRAWTREELQILRGCGAIVGTLLSRRRAQKDLERYQEILQTVLDNVEAAIYVSDLDTHEILFANKYMKETFCQKGTPIEGKTCWQTLQKGQHGPCSFCPRPRLMDKNGRPLKPYTWEHKNTVLNKWFLMTDSVIRWIDGRYVHMENARDISDLKEKEEKLREKADELKIVASTDSLTGIYNRQMGSVLFEEAYKRVLRTRKISTLCFLDLDGLKHVNDTWGHREGDRMLVSFAHIIKEVIRSVDIFCRWGGDEFLFLLEDCNMEKAEKQIIRRIQSEIGAFNRANGEKNGEKMEETPNYTLDFSYGLEEMNADSDRSLDQIIAAADRNMYDDKLKKRR